ncbi:MAG: hypothetical protein HOY71_12095 [Nonomuraea sp.]|nr:hypothetical protein [Nonomuraea sp.]
MRALLLTGGLGSGKTAVATEIGELLETPHAVVDLDWLCWVSGADVHALLTANLRAVAANYAAAGVTDLVLARALLERPHLEAVLSALPGYEVTVIRLEVSPATVLDRLSGRDSGATLAGHLAQARDFAARVAAAALEDHVVSNEGRPVGEVAAEALASWADGPRSRQAGAPGRS